MVQTFLESQDQAGFNGAHYIGVRPLKNAEKRQKTPKTVIFCASIHFHLFLSVICLVLPATAKPFELHK